MPAIVNAPAIQRKPHVPVDERTPAREEVARYVDREVLEKDRWPIPMVQLAEETGFSRTLVTDAVATYFEPVDETERTQTKRARYLEQIDVEVPIPDDLDDDEVQVYIRGWRQGFLQDFRR